MWSYKELKKLGGEFLLVPCLINCSAGLARILHSVAARALILAVLQQVKEKNGGRNHHILHLKTDKESIWW